MLGTVSALFAVKLKSNVPTAVVISVSLTATFHFAIFTSPLPLAVETYLEYVPPITATNTANTIAAKTPFFTVLFLSLFMCAPPLLIFLCFTSDFTDIYINKFTLNYILII